MKYVPLLLLLFLSGTVTHAYNRQDTLRGSNGPGRSWWDVQYYSLGVKIDTDHHVISGCSNITFDIKSKPIDSLQIDLQDFLIIDSALFWTGSEEQYPVSIEKIVKEGNAWWLIYPFHLIGNRQYERRILQIFYHGKPRTAKNPPWDGGLIWTKDSTGKPWMAVACQGLGASSWWPCKDYQGDEPDKGMSIRITIGQAESFDQYVSNGRFPPAASEIITNELTHKKKTFYHERYWSVQNPINTYSATFYIGDYAHWHDTLMGEKGVLDLDFYPLKYNEAKARKHFAVTKQMIHCFEYWMGPYPFYEDGYKLVEAPYLGMEHQSAVAYGNEYKMGYRGTDRSETGIGLLFDFIIVHESGHEWFGNSITAQDIADNWLHEGFTTYTEGLFAECATNRDSAFQYIRGEWSNIRNDRPVTGDYGVNDEGSSDKYDKGSAVVHMIRMILNDDEKFRQLLRGLNRDFYHKIVTSAEVEAYISHFVGKDLRGLFDQYLRTTDIPVLEYYTHKKKLHYRFANVVPGFTLPVPVSSDKQSLTLNITGDWQEVKWKGKDELRFSPDFLYRQRYVLDF